MVRGGFLCQRSGKAADSRGMNEVWSVYKGHTEHDHIAVHKKYGMF
jgi:hypothetical protein